MQPSAPREPSGDAAGVIGGVVVQQRVRDAEQAGLPVVRALEQTGHRLEKDRRAQQDDQPQVVPVTGQQAVAPRPLPAVDGPPVQLSRKYRSPRSLRVKGDGARRAFPQHRQHEAVVPLRRGPTGVLEPGQGDSSGPLARP